MYLYVHPILQFQLLINTLCLLQYHLSTLSLSSDSLSFLFRLSLLSRTCTISPALLRLLSRFQLCIYLCLAFEDSWIYFRGLGYNIFGITVIPCLNNSLSGRTICRCVIFMLYAIFDFIPLLMRFFVLYGSFGLKKKLSKRTV